MTLDAGPCGDLNFIVGTKGNPLTKESFGNEFRDACNLAGVPGRAHGFASFMQRALPIIAQPSTNCRRCSGGPT